MIVGIAGRGIPAFAGSSTPLMPPPERRVWRFWTVPGPERTGARDMGGRFVGSAVAVSTWVTGTYDPDAESRLLGHRQSGPRLYGKDREGDNLYTDRIRRPGCGHRGS